MSDIKELLDQTARSAGTAPSPDAVEADVLRGRAALVRRRRRRAVGSSIGGTVAAAALVATAIVAGSPDGSSETPTARPDTTTPSRQAGVRLVTYTGEQPDGFVVDWVPEGWYIQDPEHPEYSLTIASNGDTSHPDNFMGKLVVMLLSSSAPQRLPDGDPVQVGEYDGVVVDRESGSLSLFYEDVDAGRFVEVQAWHTLGWSHEQIVKFAAGVTVTSHAKAGVG